DLDERDDRPHGRMTDERRTGRDAHIIERRHHLCAVQVDVRYRQVEIVGDCEVIRHGGADILTERLKATDVAETCPVRHGFPGGFETVNVRHVVAAKHPYPAM